ncbi:MAG: stage III sporulation protein AE [Oscillospiraceae bacterium]|nr:hypothetical protein [Oscillospiraceae bacterium]MCI6026833.1 stage III sporulation protein AE [Oscillospiraceae bacterium]MDY3217736.1 hypothetical protein [Candidatus Fimivivens sp.]SFJ06985.1 stage III sporulation protein AE [Ruminococcaceae bacterium D5]
MKRYFRWICVALLCAALAIPCRAAPLSEELAAQLGIENLNSEIPLQAKEFADDADLSGLSVGEILKLSPSSLWNGIAVQMGRILSSARAQLFSILAVVLLCALLSVVSSGGGESLPFGLIANLTIFAVLLDPLISCITVCASTLRSAAQFMLAYVPVYAMVAATGGAPATAGAYQMIVLAASQFSAQFSSATLLPLLQCYLVLSLAGGLGKNKGIRSLSSGVKKVVNWSLVLMMTCFAGILSLQSFLGAAADTAAVKTVKFLAGSFIPVVGSAVTDAWAALQGSVRIIHASVGSFGVAVAVCTFLPALITVTVLRAVVAFAATVGEMLSVSEVEDILSGCGNVLSVLTALLVSMLLVSVISTATLLFLCGGGVK